ncbi:MAG: endo alpha-1,4 polygalactosaminidase, partial [Bryobacteraceae bacterium]
ESLVRTIRRRFPRITIVLNRAYSLLERVDGDVDVALGESVYATFDFAEKKYRLVDGESYRLQVSWLQTAKKRRPRLRVFTLDYWDPSDPAGISQIYREQRANGFLPYVTTIDLTQVVAEPSL